MKFVSIDIETTGLDRKNDQVLQLAMVVEDTQKHGVPVEELPTWEGLIHYDTLRGDPFALALNAELIRVLAKCVANPEDDPEFVELRGREVLVHHSFDVAIDHALDFLDKVRGNDTGKLTAAGKNVAGFDLPFLGPQFGRYFGHRVIDVGSVALGADPAYWMGERVPGLGKLTKGDVRHDALEDARDVVRVLRRLTNGYQG